MPAPDLPAAVVAKFWKHVRKDPASGCWVWAGPFRRRGVRPVPALYHWGRGRRLVNRSPRLVAWRLAGREAPANGLLTPRCGREACVSPEHLDPRPAPPRPTSGGRPWTDDEKATLRAEYGKTPLKALAARLNRPPSAVRAQARLKMKLAPVREVDPQFAGGWNPARRTAEARYASAYNLPPDLKPRAVDALVALLGGPATAAEVNRTLGLKGDTRDLAYSLRQLVERGLAVRLPPEYRRGVAGCLPAQYLPTAHALTLIAEARRA